MTQGLRRQSLVIGWLLVMVSALAVFSVAGQIDVVAGPRALAPSFGWSGAEEKPAQDETVVVEIVPAVEIVSIGETFRVQVVIRTGERQVDGAQVVLGFNPRYLYVTQTIPGTTLSDVLQNDVDNELGRIAYAAGKLLGKPPSGTFDLLTIEIRAVELTVGTPLPFLKGTRVTFEGYTVPLVMNDGRIIVAMPTPTPSPEPTLTPTATPMRLYLHLPLILREYMIQ